MPRMIKVGFYICLLAVFWLGTARAVEQKDGGPIIEIDSLTHDFKEVSQGETVRHDFTVRNNGTAPLQIKGVKPG